MYRRSSSARAFSRQLATHEAPFFFASARPAQMRMPLLSRMTGAGARSLWTRSHFAYSGQSISPSLLTAGALFGGFSLATLCAEEKKTVDYEAVRKEIAALLDPKDEDYDDGSYGPLFVRLAWHASGTYDKSKGAYGSNGATMRFKPESEDGANNGLALARKILEPIKRAHPELSYADLWTLAGAVAIEEMGGPKIPWRPGRSDAPDGRNAPKPGNLPNASEGADHIRAVFYRMGFNDQEIVALCGAHALGRCHTDRSGFSGPWTRAPTTFSNEYFKELLNNTWTKKKWNGPEQFEDPTGELMMLPADLALIKDPVFRKHVEAYAHDEQLWFNHFAAAFSKLLELGVKFPEASKHADAPAPAKKKGWW